MVLTLIIPAWNARRYLAQTIDSVLGQEGRGVELVIVDDGSTDDTARIAGRFAEAYENIRLIPTENRGVSHARNLGLAAARGRYIGFLDADDVLCRDACSREFLALLARETCDILSMGYICGDQELRRGTLCPETSATLRREEPGFLRAGSRKSLCSYLFRRQLLEGLRFYEGIRYSEDMVFLYLAASRARGMRLLDRYWFVYRNNVHSAIHRTGGYGYILTDHIPAWYRAGLEEKSPEGQWDCFGMVYSQMGQYLRQGALTGIPRKQLRREMEDCIPFRQVCAQPGTFWVKEDTAAIIEDFRRPRGRIWWKLRLTGLVTEPVKALLRRPLPRRLYLRLKHRIPLDGYLITR